MNRFTLLVLLLLPFLACEKENPMPEEPPTNLESGLLISNEGGFGFGNASVSYYDIAKDSLSNQIFQNANNRSLGDVLQSIRVVGEKAYLIINNSNKIEVVNTSDFKSFATIDGLTSPRYLLPLNNQKAYVSDLYADAISIIDLEQNELTGNIPIPGWSEEMALHGNEAFITVRENNFLYVINTQSDELIDSIEIGFNPSTIQKDKNNQLWVLCSGDQSSGEAGGLFQVDPISKTVVKTLTFSDTEIGGWPRLRINGSKDTLYYLKEAVYQFPINNNSLPNSAFIPEDGRILYGLGVNPKTGRVFVSDVIDYQQKGLIYHYTQDGELLTTFNVGVIPNDFVFLE